MRNYVARVAAAIDDFFEQLVEILQNNDLNRLMLSVEKLFVQLDYVLVRFAFDELQFVVQLFDLLKIHSVSQSLHQLQDDRGSPFEQSDLPCEIDPANELRREQQSLK